MKSLRVVAAVSLGCVLVTVTPLVEPPALADTQLCSVCHAMFLECWGDGPPEIECFNAVNLCYADCSSSCPPP